MSYLIRSYRCAVPGCNQRAWSYGTREDAPPLGFSPEGWVDLGAVGDVCPDHAADGEAYLREMDLWYIRRANWERDGNPRPRPPWSHEPNGEAK